eukprot:CAMPEP_0172195964 /NCGR_PEP_ID=MMETSP1050-20130122/26523_1 /TAXON_ID=233186 /ORGANISM="Cryptomonas curvata, Strain CCAP979/52" /LENGTH=57 /DNA_ID=CAMNT_0012872131 /DNA_START=47 /DNA_END=217 /DNA_ORIENTATION=+
MKVTHRNGTVWTLTARKFLVCTGAGPATPSIRGLSAVPFLTYRDVLASFQAARSVRF